MPRDQDPALWYAKRLRESHPVPFPVSLDSLLNVCQALRVAVTLSPGLSKGGQFWAGPDPLIVIQRPCPWLLSHELLHALALECEPERGLCEEKVCNRFAWLLCSGQEEARQLLGVTAVQIAGPEITDYAFRNSDLAERVTAAPPLHNSALIYAWAPRPPQLGGQASTQRQARECRECAEAEGYPPARVFADFGSPMAGHERPEGSRLARNAAQWRSEGVAAVYVAHLSRVGPSRSLRQPMMAALEEGGLVVRSLELPFWSSFYR